MTKTQWRNKERTVKQKDKKVKKFDKTNLICATLTHMHIQRTHTKCQTCILSCACGC